MSNNVLVHVPGVVCANLVLEHRAPVLANPRVTRATAAGIPGAL